jgi:hypothetical protein
MNHFDNSQNSLNGDQRTNSFIYTEQHNSPDKRRHTIMPLVGFIPGVAKKKDTNGMGGTQRALTEKVLNDLYARVFKHTNIKTRVQSDLQRQGLLPSFININWNVTEIRTKAQLGQLPRAAVCISSFAWPAAVTQVA